MANSTGFRPSVVLGGTLLFVGMLVLASCGDDGPSTNVADGADSEAVVVAYFDSFNAGDADAVLALVTSDATFTEEYGFGQGDELEREDLGGGSRLVHSARGRYDGALMH